MISWLPLVLAALGFGLSWYAYHVEQYAGKKKGYHPACDINDNVSCTKAFTSAYGTTFGLSNGTWGMMLYLVMIVLALLGEVQWLFLLSCATVLASIYLAYVLYFKVRTWCIICTSVYVINIALVISTYFIGFGSA